MHPSLEACVWFEVASLIEADTRLSVGRQHRRRVLNRAACYSEIMALQNCHLEHGYLRFVGYCNQQKLDLTKCFRAEVRRRAQCDADAAAYREARRESREGEGEAGAREGARGPLASA